MGLDYCSISSTRPSFSPMTEQPRERRIAGSLPSLRSVERLFVSLVGVDPVQLLRLQADSRTSLRDLVNSSTLAAAFVIVSAVYCFGIGRDRYLATSEFVIKQPLPPATASTTVLGSMQSSSVLSSLEDGRYLQVYLKSNAVASGIS